MRNDTVSFLLSYLKVVLNNQNWGEVARVKEELKLIFFRDSYGFLVRSRYKQNAEEERASLFHAAKEISNDKNNINALKINDEIVRDPELIKHTYFFQ